MHGPGDRLRDRRRRARRALVGAHDARPRGRERVRLRGPERQHVRRRRTASSTPRRKIEFTFNWFYADDKDIAMFSSGRLPDPPPAGRHRAAHEGHRQVRVARLPRRRTSTRTATTPADGTIIELEQQAGAGWQAADDNWGYGSVHRNELLERTRRPGRDAHAGVHGRRDELRRHAGPAGGRRRSAASARCSRPARRRAPAPSRCSTCSQDWRDAAVAAGSTATSTARSTTRARRSWTRHGRRSPTR